MQAKSYLLRQLLKLKNNSYLRINLERQKGFLKRDGHAINAKSCNEISPTPPLCQGVL
jgi:hypothetical protein